MAAWIDSPSSQQIDQQVDAVEDGRLTRPATDDRTTWTRNGEEIAKVGQPGVACDGLLGAPDRMRVLAPRLCEALTR